MPTFAGGAGWYEPWRGEQRLGCSLPDVQVALGRHLIQVLLERFLAHHLDLNRYCPQH